MAVTPTKRTLKALRDMGRVPIMVERWNPFAGVRQDALGIIDIIALDFEQGVVGVQSTGQDFAGHWQKLTGSHADMSALWLRTPGTRLELWGWRKLKPRGTNRQVWMPRIKEITLRDLL